MEFDRLNKWLTLGANIGIISGIIFLIIELNQNSELMRVQINQSRAESAMASLQYEFNSDYIPPILAKIRSGQTLADEEWIRYVAWFRMMNRNQDNVLNQYYMGMLGENTPRSVRDFAGDVVGSSQYGLDAWEVTRPGFTDAYINFVESAIEEDQDKIPVR